MINNDFFAEFPPVSKDNWLAQIAKDLKDKPMDSLVWPLAEGLAVSPFVHREDFSTPPTSLTTVQAGWEICEKIIVSDAVTANKTALEALEGGAEALKFSFDTTPAWPAFDQLMAGIHPDYIGLHFTGKGVADNPGALLAHLQQLAISRQINPRLLHGSIEFDPLHGNAIVDWRFLAELQAFAFETFPHFRIITIPFSENEHPAVALAETLQVAHVYLTKLSERGVSLKNAAEIMQFNATVGKSYFLEIAKLRAFKLLWFNLLEAWEATPVHPVITAEFQPETYSDDLYTNMIRSTTMAMSAVLGGVQSLSVLPYDANRAELAKYPAAFGRRIARNVQHLLKMESHLDAINDPAAGSYYIETLTMQLAKAGWEVFTKAK